MKTIYKYEIETTDHQEIMLPQGAGILTVQTQDDLPCLWACVDTEAPIHPQEISIFGTGHLVPENIGEYIGTYQLNNGRLVFHVFKSS